MAYARSGVTMVQQAGYCAKVLGHGMVLNGSTSFLICLKYQEYLRLVQVINEFMIGFRYMGNT